MGAILIYDLRKSSREVSRICVGHKHTINSLRFTHKGQNSPSIETPAQTASVSIPAKTIELQTKPPPIRTMDQIRAEAKKVTEQRKKDADQFRLDLPKESKQDQKKENAENIDQQNRDVYSSNYMEVPYENAKYNDPAASRGPEKETALMTED
jgi:hypothetical protein